MKKIKQWLNKFMYHTKVMWRVKVSYRIRYSLPAVVITNIRRRWFGLIKKYDMVVYKVERVRKDRWGKEIKEIDYRIGQVEYIDQHRYGSKETLYVVIDVCPCRLLGTGRDLKRNMIVENIEWKRDYSWDYFAGLHDAYKDREYDLRSEVDCQNKDRYGVCQCDNHVCEIDFEKEEFWDEVVRNY